ncbi:MAG: HD domain-containing protein [Candidatus Methanomethylophilaceae archaeon]|nr:HD domain-containing protein [Candidatus Methanomethylophilaceae archaeon]
MDEDVFKRAERFAESVFEGDSSGHDIYHTLRVHSLARSICAEEGGDEGTVRLAALLHDVDDPKLFGGEGYPNARRFMEGEELGRDTVERVVGIISQISFRGSGAAVPDSLEGKIVQDADRMDAIGAIGIARAFAYGGSRGRPMHVPGEPPREGMTEAEYRSSQGTTVNHFHEKLLKLKDLMNTGTARRMAEARHRYMAGFLEELMDEWDGKRRSPGRPVSVVRLEQKYYEYRR